MSASIVFGYQPDNGSNLPAYADHSDPDAMPTAHDVAEMIEWQRAAMARAADHESFDRSMRRAYALIDRAHENGMPGYAQSALAELSRALPVAERLGGCAIDEAQHAMGEAFALERALLRRVARKCKLASQADTN